MRNLHRRFDWQYIGQQMYNGDFAKFWGLLRMNELFTIPMCKNLLLKVFSVKLKFFFSKIVAKCDVLIILIKLAKVAKKIK